MLCGMNAGWQRLTVREFVTNHRVLAGWWLQATVAFAVATAISVASGHVGFAIFTAVCGAYCWCFVVSTARYGKRSFRVFRFIFRRGYGDY